MRRSDNNSQSPYKPSDRKGGFSTDEGMPFSSLESIEEIAREAPYLTAPVEGTVRRGATWRYTPPRALLQGRLGKVVDDSPLFRPIHGSSKGPLNGGQR
ncbi:hypothetical protein HMPREF1556_00399 [Porphyromonas sp. oral taxon 278 str. W7784]|nr:hypothetical protein HMPREF1556_00399 [Porphyromonas sp. oral taxon 278 str. W7784]